MTQMVSWLPAPERVRLRHADVHVWYADLDRLSETARNFEQLLSEDERQRASKFFFQRDRERFIVARGVLRSILSRYLNRAPAELRLQYSPFGKPALFPDQDEAALRFNLSHSIGTALYGVTLGREIGLDIEYIREDVAVIEIAQRFFSQQEIAQLLALPAEAQRAAFSHCWTRKEAYIKARGEGLSLPLDQFTVSLAPGEPAALVCASEPQEVSRWHLQNVTVEASYAAALAVEGGNWTLQCWEWEPGAESLPV
jgi:4'-phosphopantetheinyl transferase